ncbi:MAG: hypothetical protein KF752_03760 [Pirellulaceae bacterium]|nr:hypothetical protein [Pirellulaceae bacterium]
MQFQIGAKCRLCYFIGIVSGVSAVLGTLTAPARADDATVQQRAGESLRMAARALNSQDYQQAVALAKHAAGQMPDDARVQQRAAELIYCAGQPHASLPLFDRANQLDPQRAAHNWQRGIALATCGEFERGAEQFQSHHQVNPDDVENSAWYFLCLAKAHDVATAQLKLIPSRGDRRPPMMSILKMLQQEIGPQAVLAVANEQVAESPQREAALFYAELYIGLYYDALGQTDRAAEFLRRSQRRDISGYMKDTARVYLMQRFDQTDNNDLQAQP